MAEATDDDYETPQGVEGFIEAFEWDDGCVSCAIDNISAQALSDIITHLQGQLTAAQENAPTLH